MPALPALTRGALPSFVAILVAASALLAALTISPRGRASWLIARRSQVMTAVKRVQELKAVSRRLSAR